MSDMTIGAINAGQGQSAITSGKSVQGTGFSNILRDSIDAVTSQQNEAKVLTEGLLSGEHSNIHETIHSTASDQYHYAHASLKTQRNLPWAAVMSIPSLRFAQYQPRSHGLPVHPKYFEF